MPYCEASIEDVCQFVGREAPAPYKQEIRKSGDCVRVIDENGDLVGIFPAEELTTSEIRDIQKSAEDKNSCMDSLFFDNQPIPSSWPIEVVKSVECDPYAEPLNSVFDGCFPWSNRS